MVRGNQAEIFSSASGKIFGNVAAFMKTSVNNFRNENSFWQFVKRKSLFSFIRFSPLSLSKLFQPQEKKYNGQTCSNFVQTVLPFVKFVLCPNINFVESLLIIHTSLLYFSFIKAYSYFLNLLEIMIYVELQIITITILEKVKLAISRTVSLSIYKLN